MIVRTFASRCFFLLHATLGLTFVFFSLGCSSNPSSGTSGKRISEYKNDAGEVDAITFQNAEVVDADLDRVANASALLEVSFQECKNVTDSGFQKLKDAKNMESLSVLHTPISDNALSSLAGFENLKKIHFVNTNITGSGLSNLKDSQIEEVMLQGEEFTVEGMKSIEALPHATELTLVSQSFSLGGFTNLGALKKLTHLDADRIQVGKDGAQVLKGLDSLKKLELNSPDIDDAAVESINTLVNLEELVISNASLGNEGLKNLKLPNLRQLNLNICKNVSDAGLGYLSGVPNLEIIMLEQTGVREDITGLGSLKNLKEVHLLKETFSGGEAAANALKMLLPEVMVSISAE